MFERQKWYDKLPDVNLEVYEPHLKLFFELMYERQMIWKRRFIDKRERPWTDNVIFQQSKFTNVYRELDRNSQWQIKNILLDEGLSLLDLVWKMMVFRYFNNPETFTSGMEDRGWRNGIPSWKEYNEDEFADFITSIREQGRNPYTSAYLVNSCAARGQSRDYCYTRVVVPTLHKTVPKIISIAKSAEQPEEIIKFLKTLPCTADFIAHEFYQDYTYIPRYTNKVLMKFTQNDFTNVGPGASVGIRLIYPNLKNTKAQKQAIYWLRDIAEEQINKAAEGGEPMAYLYWNKEKRCYEVKNECNITLHQVEMWLCEFQKYWKMTIGQGKQRSKFEPRIKEITIK